MLGAWDGRLLGRDDDRHVVTVAGSRAGKSSTVLIPNLLRYPGSAIVLDPKGELARATAEHRRRRFGPVYVLDPFGESGMPSCGAQSFHRTRTGQARACCSRRRATRGRPYHRQPTDPHWTDFAKNLVRGIALHLLGSDPEKATLRELRRLLNATPAELDRLFKAMVDSTAFDGIVANIGASFLGKKEAGGRELQGILSTAQEQTAPLDDVLRITDRSDFDLNDLRPARSALPRAARHAHGHALPLAAAGHPAGARRDGANARTARRTSGLVHARRISGAPAYAAHRDRSRPDGRLRRQAVVGPAGPDPAQDPLPQQLGNLPWQCRRSSRPSAMSI